jgi:hypothetical protein
MAGEDNVRIGAAYAAATRSGRADAIAAVTEPDAVVSHSFDGRVADRAYSERTAAWLRTAVPDITWDDVAIHPTPTGFVWQAVITGTAPGGALRAHTCAVVTLSPAGKVARMDEYVDSAPATAAVRLAPRAQ